MPAAVLPPLVNVTQVPQITAIDCVAGFLAQVSDGMAPDALAAHFPPTGWSVTVSSVLLLATVIAGVVAAAVAACAPRTCTVTSTAKGDECVAALPNSGDRCTGFHAACGLAACQLVSVAWLACVCAVSLGNLHRRSSEFATAAPRMLCGWNASALRFRTLVEARAATDSEAGEAQLHAQSDPIERVFAFGCALHLHPLIDDRPLESDDILAEIARTKVGSTTEPINFTRPGVIVLLSLNLALFVLFAVVAAAAPALTSYTSRVTAAAGGGSADDGENSWWDGALRSFVKPNRDVSHHSCLSVTRCAVPLVTMLFLEAFEVLFAMDGRGGEWCISRADGAAGTLRSNLLIPLILTPAIGVLAVASRWIHRSGGRSDDFPQVTVVLAVELLACVGVARGLLVASDAARRLEGRWDLLLAHYAPAFVPLAAPLLFSAAFAMTRLAMQLPCRPLSRGGATHKENEAAGPGPAAYHSAVETPVNSAGGSPEFGSNLSITSITVGAPGVIGAASEFNSARAISPQPGDDGGGLSTLNPTTHSTSATPLSLLSIVSPKEEVRGPTRRFDDLVVNWDETGSAGKRSAEELDSVQASGRPGPILTSPTSPTISPADEHREASGPSHEQAAEPPAAPGASSGEGQTMNRLSRSTSFAGSVSALRSPGPKPHGTPRTPKSVRFGPVVVAEATSTSATRAPLVQQLHTGEESCTFNGSFRLPPPRISGSMSRLVCFTGGISDLRHTSPPLLSIQNKQCGGPPSPCSGPMRGVFSPERQLSSATSTASSDTVTPSRAATIPLNAATCPQDHPSELPPQGAVDTQHKSIVEGGGELYRAYVNDHSTMPLDSLGLVSGRVFDFVQLLQRGYENRMYCAMMLAPGVLGVAHTMGLSLAALVAALAYGCSCSNADPGGQSSHGSRGGGGAAFSVHEMLLLHPQSVEPHQFRQMLADKIEQARHFCRHCVFACGFLALQAAVGTVMCVAFHSMMAAADAENARNEAEIVLHLGATGVSAAIFGLAAVTSVRSYATRCIEVGEHVTLVIRRGYSRSATLQTIVHGDADAT